MQILTHYILFEICLSCWPFGMKWNIRNFKPSAWYQVAREAKEFGEGMSLRRVGMKRKWWQIKFYNSSMLSIMKHSSNKINEIRIMSDISNMSMNHLSKFSTYNKQSQFRIQKWNMTRSCCSWVRRSFNALLISQGINECYHKWMDTKRYDKTYHKIMFHGWSTVDHTLRNTLLLWETPVLNHEVTELWHTFCSSRWPAEITTSTDMEDWPSSSTSPDISNANVNKTRLILLQLLFDSSSHPSYAGTTWLCVSFHSPAHKRTTTTMIFHNTFIPTPTASTIIAESNYSYVVKFSSPWTC